MQSHLVDSKPITYGLQHQKWNNISGIIPEKSPISRKNERKLQKTSSNCLKKVNRCYAVNA